MSASSDAARDLVILGRIVGVYGVRGWVKVRSWTRPPENILQFPGWWLEEGQGWKHVKVVVARPQGKGLVAAIDGIGDRETARERLVGRNVAVPRGELPAPEPDEIYWSDLLGMAVETVDGLALGEVDHLLETGANDVLVVQGDRQRLIPYIDTVVVRVDPAARRLWVDWDPEF